MKNSVLAGLLFLCFVSGAQPNFRFDHLTIQDGLSQSQPYCIFQDSKGYVWIGTQDGLNRFDGYDFKIYKNDPFDSTTLTHNWVWSVAEDAHGDIWVGTFQGLCQYVRNEDRFIQYYYSMEDSTSISGNRPNYILKDKKGRLWISSWGGGLNLYDEKSKSFRRFKHDPENNSSISSNAVRTLFCDQDGILWVGTWNGGLNRVIEDEKGIRFKQIRINPEAGFEGGNRITSITEDQYYNLWIASYESGLMVVDKTTEQFSRIPNFMPNDVNKVMRDSKNNMWVGTNNGLHYFDSQTKKFTHFTEHNDPNGISSNVIYDVYEDHQGIVWISGNGLDLYDPKKNIFQSFSNKPGNANSLSQNVVWTFCEDEEGNIWIGTEAGPLNVFDPKSKSFRHITLQDDRGNLAQNIRRIVEDGDVLWIASYNAGLIRYEKKTNKAKFFTGNPATPLGKLSQVDEILLDRDGTLWIGTTETGLFHFNPNTSAVEHFTINPKDPNSIGANFINSLYQDHRGNIWIGLWGGGMSMYDKVAKKFINYTYDRKNPKGLSDQVVISITQESDSTFWICTHTGLNRLNVNTGVFTHYFEKDGLANNVTYEVLTDTKNNVWISTNGGLSKFDPSTGTFKNYTQEDGLQSNEFNSKAALKSSIGELYFGGINGFTVFRPEQFRADTVMPQLVISTINVFDQELPIHQQKITLAYHQNYLSFRFAALEFSSPEKINYAYRLEGLNNQWIDAGNNRVASFTNLGPGSYTFRVKASNADGYWNDEGTFIQVVIYPPFWKTSWFIGLCILTVIGIAYALHRYRLTQSLQVERLRNKIASDLHDEVGSSLTRISIYSDLLQTGADENESKGYLTGISELSREIVSTMSDIVWSIDNRNDSIGALILRMKDFATEMTQSKNIEMDFAVEHIDETKTLDPALKQNLYLIFKESINNIIKHAKANHVHIRLVNQGDTFMMTIQDNGIGFQPRGSQKGNGLRNMERRAKAIGGIFTQESSQGTIISVKRKTL